MREGVREEGGRGKGNLSSALVGLVCSVLILLQLLCLLPGRGQQEGRGLL